MSGISTGIGLISGIDTATLIDQLISLERRPIDTLQTRVRAIDLQRTVFLELSAQLLAVQNAASGFGRPTFFRRFSANSSNESVLTATATDKAVPGSVTFRVRSLVSTHSMISRGFADTDSTPLGVGTFTIEVGKGKVNTSTDLDMLNGGQGVRRGTITITDRSGASTDVDLSMAITVDDVLQAINTDPAINVRASITGVTVGGATGDRLVIEDLSGSTVANLTITDKSGGSMAADLGIAASVSAGRIDGVDLIRLTSATPLTMLNDGNGIGRLRSGTDLSFATTNGDFDVSLTNILATQLETDLRILNSGNGIRLGVIRFTDRSGQSTDIDLTGAVTVRDVIETINREAEAGGVSVSATVVGIGDASHFQITETSGLTGEDAEDLVIEDVSGFTAADLGVSGVFDSNDVLGKNIYRIATIGDLVNVINYAQGNDSLVEASISVDGNGLVLRALMPGSSVTVTAGDGSGAAQSLGLLDAGFDSDNPLSTRSLIAGLNTVLLTTLNGGSGVRVKGDTVVGFTDRTGSFSQVDFSTARTLQDVIDLINNDPITRFSASVNSAGNGLTLVDKSGGIGPLTIVDQAGSLAANLGIAVTDDPAGAFVGNTVNGGNLQLQYVTPQTLLSDLNAGRGIRSGEIRITDSNGAVFDIDLDVSLETVGEVIARINLVVPDSIEARINDSGDGIIVTDSLGGSKQLTIEDRNGGGAAADLRLAGKASPGEDFIDGSFEIRIELDGDDTLSDLVKKINDSGGAVSASILNHGAGLNPHSLSLTSRVSGKLGELLVDSLGRGSGGSRRTCSGSTKAPGVDV